MFSKFLLLILLITATVFLIGCGPSAIEQLEDEVLEIHDEVMPWLDDMKAKRRKLVKRQPLSEADSMNMLNTSKLLHRGDSMMWNWMYQYRPVSELEDSLNAEELEGYLRHQKTLIIEVNQVIKEGMKRADEILANSTEDSQ